MVYRVINIALGIWLIVAPAVLVYGGTASTNDRIIGPLVATFATVAIWETTRELRRINTLLGAWLIIAPLVLGYEGVTIVNSIVVGGMIIAISLKRGEINTQFGGGWSDLWQQPSPHIQAQTKSDEEE